MNKKIFAQLLAYSQNDLDKITQPYILETFGVEVKRCDTLEEYSAVINDACLNRYFSKPGYISLRKLKQYMNEKIKHFAIVTNKCLFQIINCLSHIS